MRPFVHSFLGIVPDNPTVRNRRQRLSSQVVWATSPVPLWRRAARWVPAAVWALVLLGLAAGGGSGVASNLPWPDARDPQLPDDPDVDPVGSVWAWGQGAGLPTAFPSKQLVSVYLDRATVQPGLTERILPLADLQLRSARRRGLPWTARKAVDATWRLHLTGEGTDLSMQGTWVLLAQIGTLAGWPEPD